MKKESHHIDLLNGHIFPSLTGLALPIMATSLVQTAYNLTDMAWIGRVGSHAVTAVGAAGMYTWFSSGIVMLAKMGGQVKVAHSLGKQQREEARAYGRGALQLTVLLALAFALIANLYADSLIGFFRLENAGHSTGGKDLSQDYLRPDSVSVFESDTDRVVYGGGRQQDSVSGKLHRACYEYDPGSGSYFWNRSLSANGGSRSCCGHGYGTDDSYPCFDDESFQGAGAAA